jgi:PAT family beta-lactamase induction signal transducer AmpG
VRSLLLSVVLLSWTWAVVTVGSFMVRVLSPVVPGGNPCRWPTSPNIRGHGSWLATVVVPLGAAIANRLKARGQHVTRDEEAPAGLRAAAVTSMPRWSRLWPSWPGGWAGACWW